VQIVHVAVEMSNNPHCIVHHWSCCKNVSIFFGWTFSISIFVHKWSLSVFYNITFINS